MPVTTMTIDALCVSPLNVRTNQVDVNALDAMKKSLLKRGQIFPLAVHPMPAPGKGKKQIYGAIAGGRRYRAFAQLIKEGKLPKDHPIDVIVRNITDEGELRELSLAENFVRRELRHYEIYAAVARAVEKGRTFQEVAETNGQEIATVRRWARLGQLHPTVFAALESEEIGEAIAMAIAGTEDVGLQLLAFEQFRQLPSHQQHPSAIRKLLKFGDRELEKLLKFVGEDVYRNEGGRYELDLFADQAEQRGAVRDEGLLRQLADAKLDAVREQLRTRTGRILRFEAGPPMSTFAGYSNGVAQELEIREKELPLSPDEEAKIEAFELELAEVEARAAKYERDGMVALLAEAEIEEKSIGVALADLRNSRPLELPDGDVFATLTILDDGNVEYRFWWADRKAKQKAEAAARKQPDAPPPRPISTGPNLAPVRAALSNIATRNIGDGEAISNTGYNARQNADAAIRETHGLTQDGVQIHRSIRREMLRAALLQESDFGTLGLDYLIFQLARHALANNYSHQLGAVGLHQNFESGNVLAEPHVERTEAHRMWRAARDQLKAHPSMTEQALPAAFRAYRAETESWKIEAAAIVAGLALERSANAPGYVVSLHDELFAQAHYDDADLRALVEPTAELIDLMTRADRLKLVYPHVSNGEYLRLEKLKAAQLTGPVVRALQKVAGWVHPLLRFNPPAPIAAPQPEMAEAAE